MSPNLYFSKASLSILTRCHFLVACTVFNNSFFVIYAFAKLGWFLLFKHQIVINFHPISQVANSCKSISQLQKECRRPRENSFDKTKHRHHQGQTIFN